MVIAGIILAALAIFGFIVTTVIEMNEEQSKGFSFFGWLCGGFCILGLCMSVVEHDKANKPSAMDVYQGKTTLEYTVVDGVIKDSTVVWKDVLQQ